VVAELVDVGDLASAGSARDLAGRSIKLGGEGMPFETKSGRRGRAVMAWTSRAALRHTPQSLDVGNP
jgi:hypothetical protein